MYVQHTNYILLYLNLSRITLFTFWCSGVNNGFLKTTSVVTKFIAQFDNLRLTYIEDLMPLSRKKLCWLPGNQKYTKMYIIT